MRTFRRMFAVAALAALALAVPAAADEPSNYTFSPTPPGTIAGNQLVYLAGEAMHSQWRAVASKKKVGSSSGTDFYQWYLTIYAIDDTKYKQQYQSPSGGGPLATVTQASGGGTMWYPLQQLTIVGSAELMLSGVQQLVVESHEQSADCGAGTVTIFTLNGGKPAPAVSVQNGCELTATIVHAPSGDSIQLSGPYYAHDAAMCCPTKPKATAMLRYRNGQWVETPPYYQVFPGKFAPN
jgi:hypothetical protein